MEPSMTLPSKIEGLAISNRLNYFSMDNRGAKDLMNFQSVKPVISRCSSIHEQENELLDEKRHLVIKRGRKLGGTVTRWVQITDNGKLKYFKSQHSNEQLGVLNLYQAVVTKTSTDIPASQRHLFMKDQTKAQSILIHSKTNFTLIPLSNYEQVFLHIRAAASGHLQTQNQSLSKVISENHSNDLPAFSDDQVTEKIICDSIVNEEDLDSGNDQSEKQLPNVMIIDKSTSSSKASTPRNTHRPIPANPRKLVPDQVPQQPNLPVQVQVKLVGGDYDGLKSFHESDYDQTEKSFDMDQGIAPTQLLGNNHHRKASDSFQLCKSFSDHDEHLPSVGVFEYLQSKPVQSKVDQLKKVLNLLQTHHTMPNKQVQRQQEKLDFHSMQASEALYLGINETRQFDFKTAKKIFRQFSNLDARHKLHEIELGTVKVLMTGRKKQIDKSILKVMHFEKELARIQGVKSPPLEQSAKNDKDYLEGGYLTACLSVDALELIQTELNMFKGILKFLRGNRFKAFLTLRDCWKSYRKFERLIEKEPQEFDDDLKARVYFGLGIFQVLVSALPRSITTLMTLVGFSGNREKGKENLNHCLQMRKARSPFAAMILCLYHIDLDPDLDRVCAILKEYLDNFPHCALFHWIASIVSWRFAQLDDAVFFINRALNKMDPQISKQAVFLRYEVGWFHYLKLEFESAHDRFIEVLRDCLNLSFLDQNGDVAQDLISKFKVHHQNQSEDIMLSPGKASNYQTDEDFVFLPHRACLTMQLVGTLVALGHTSQLEYWLKTTIALANQPGLTRSKLDQDMGSLAYLFMTHRPESQLLPYEIIYFLHQIPKMPNNVLLLIIQRVTNCLKKIEMRVGQEVGEVENRKHSDIAEFVSGTIIVMIAYCFLGDSDIAAMFGERLLPVIQILAPQYAYLKVHGWYWVARAFVSEGNKPEAVKLLNKAKRMKKYEFDIEKKIERVLVDIRK